MKILKILLLYLLSYQLAKADSPVKHDSVKFVMKQINFNASFKTDSSFIDSSINKLHILNPAFRQEHSFEQLIRVGYPLISNSLVTRTSLNDFFYPSNYFAPFIFDDTKNIFYDTKKQFTSLTYEHSGGTATRTAAPSLVGKGEQVPALRFQLLGFGEVFRSIKISEHARINPARTDFFFFDVLRIC